MLKSLYIDPGTGSMLFTIIIGIASVVVFGLRKLFYKIKFILSGGRQAKIDSAKIPYLIFSDSKRYWNVFKPICDEFEKRGEDITYWTASPDDPALSTEYKHVKTEFIGEGNKAYVKLNFCNADVVISTTPGLDVYQWKRSKTAGKYVHVPHGVNDVSMYRMFGLDRYDVVFVSADYHTKQIRQLEKMRNLPPKDVVMAGQTYMDDMVARLEREGRKQNDVRTVLLAPSWGVSSIFNRFGSALIDELINTGYKIIVRPHPQSYISDPDMMKELIAKYPETDKFKWNKDNDNFDVLNEADILISDFSGIQFDFSLVFGKPIIFTDTEYDKSPYDAAWIDDELWTFNALPRLGKQLTMDNLTNIKSMIDELIDDKKYAEQRQEVIDETWQMRGKATQTMVDYLLNMKKENKKNKR